MDDDDKCLDVTAAVTDLKAHCRKHGPQFTTIAHGPVNTAAAEVAGKAIGFIPISITKNTPATTMHAHTLLDEHGEEENHNQNVQWLCITGR